MKDDWRQKQAEAEAFNKRVLKETILPYLISKGVVRVVATYNGSGDDGQLSIDGYYDANNDQPEVEAQFDRMDVGYSHRTVENPVITTPVDLNRFVEDFLEEKLESHYGGWEINEGSCGEVSLDLQTGRYNIEHRSRYEAYDDFSDSGEI